MIQNFNKNFIVLLIVALLIIAGGTIYYYKKGERAREEISAQEVKERVISYINENVPGVKATLIDIVPENGLYKITLQIRDQKFISYATKDGKLFFPQAINLEKPKRKASSQKPPKSQIPDIKLFVMSYCPFGLQAEKALLHAWKLLKEKANIGIYFVDYIMHGKKEIDENLRQYCIQRKEPEKFLSYLDCFVKEGDFEKCLKEAEINEEKLSTCEDLADKEFKITENYSDKNSWLDGRFPKFEVHFDLNKKYGVSGSPTLVINDQVVSVSQRSPESFKNAICQAFSSLPKECSEKLSDKIVSPGFETGESTQNGGSM